MISGVVRIRVLDIHGPVVFSEEKVKEQDLMTLQIDLRNVSKGIYFVQLQLDDKVYSQKVILD